MKTYRIIETVEYEIEGDSEAEAVADFLKSPDSYFVQVSDRNVEEL